MTPSSSPLPARNFFYKLMASEKAYVARPRPSAFFNLQNQNPISEEQI